MLRSYEYPPNAVVVSQDDNYPSSFALVDGRPKTLASLMYGIIEARDPRVFPVPPDVIVSTLTSALLGKGDDALDGVAVMEASRVARVKLADSLFDSPGKPDDDSSMEVIRHLGRPARAAMTITALNNRLTTLLGPDRMFMSDSETWKDLISRCRDATVADTHMGMDGLALLDVITASASPTFAAFFNAKALENNELMRRNRAYYVTEVTEQLGAIMAAASVSLQCARIKPILWLMRAPEVWPQIERLLGVGELNSLATDMANVQRLAAAIDTLESVPQGYFVREFVQRWRPAPITTIYGPRTAYFAPKAPSVPFGPASSLFDFDPRDFVRLFGDEIVAAAERIEEYREALTTGWNQLGYSPTSGVGSFPSPWQSVPLIWSTTGWTQSVPSILDAAFLPRLVAAQDGCELTRRLESIWHWTDLTLITKGLGQRALDDEMPVYLRPIVARDPVSSYPHAWEPRAYRPFRPDWRGEADSSYIRIPNDIGQVAAQLGITMDQAQDLVRANLQGDFAHLFEEVDGEPVPRSPEMFRTWVTSDPSIRRMSIPYVGPRNFAVRISMTSFVNTRYRSRLQVDYSSEDLTFDTSNLVGDLVSSETF